MNLWCGLLTDLPPDVLNRACEQAARIARFFPMPGDIRASVDQANARELEREADNAWNSALEYAHQWYLPDMGLDRRAPALPEKMQRAIGAAGGLRFLESCDESDLIWARKRFIEAFTHFDELERAGLLLTRGDAKGILDEVGAGDLAQRRALPRSAETEAPDGG